MKCIFSLNKAIAGKDVVQFLSSLYFLYDSIYNHTYVCICLYRRRLKNISTGFSYMEMYDLIYHIIFSSIFPYIFVS